MLTEDVFTHASIEQASSLHRACIEPASSYSIEPASSFQHREAGAQIFRDVLHSGMRGDTLCRGVFASVLPLAGEDP